MNGAGRTPGHKFSSAYRRYVLVVLGLVYALNSVDSNLMVLLLQPVKDDLRLSDTQLGFVTGIAFGLFYATFGLPIARWADRGNRSTIAALAIGVWGLTVMGSVLVRNYVQLVAARIAAGIGESGGMPPTYSLLGDYFPGPAERARAMAVYWVANPLAAFLCLAIGGWLNRLYGWRVTFFLMGLPGLLVALLVKLTVIEPRTLGHQGQPTAHESASLTAVARGLWRQPTIRNLISAYILLCTMGSGMGPWTAAFLMRSHGMNTAELGIWLGTVVGLSCSLGIAFGGYAAGRWFANSESRQLQLSGLTMASLPPCYALFLFLPNKYAALATLVPIWTVFGFYVAPTFALMQRLVPDDIRATTAAVVMLLANIIGLGAGPELVGFASDLLHPALGLDSLRFAMLAMTVIGLWSGFHFRKAAQTVREDLLAVSGRAPFEGQTAASVSTELRMPTAADAVSGKR